MTKIVMTDQLDNSNNNNGSNINISSLSFEKLLREPNQINELKTKTIKEMQKLALDHYQLFIENYKTLNYTVSNIQNVSNQIENGLLNKCLPDISSSCESFSSKSHSLTESRSSIKNLLDNFATLLDILEIPQLMDTCIKNNSFDEALQLESFSKKILKQYPNNKVVLEIVKEVKQCTRSLITTLQQQLRLDISLTNCIKTIGYLRRLSIYKENELKIIFLHSRDQWLINSLKFETDTNHVTYLTKLTDSCRTNIFDIVTQYNAIFSANESNQEDQLDDLILYNWVQQKIKIYISIIDSTLSHIKSGSSISYILDNSMYFSMSISRVGIDFRNLLEPIFEKHILNNFVSQITTASHHFLETLKTYKFPVQKSTTNNNTTTTNLSSSSQQQYISPPLSILQHQPLAVLVNLILKSFNELKDCFPISLKSLASIKLKESLITVIGGVTSFYNQQLSNTNTISNFISGSGGSGGTVNNLSSFDKVFHSFCKCLAEDFIPFIVKCFDIICCQQQLLQSNEGNSIGIDIDSLVLSLKKIYSTEPIQSSNDDDLPPIPDLVLKSNKQSISPEAPSTAIPQTLSNTNSTTPTAEIVTIIESTTAAETVNNNNDKNDNITETANNVDNSNNDAPETPLESSIQTTLPPTSQANLNVETPHLQVATDELNEEQHNDSGDSSSHQQVEANIIIDHDDNQINDTNRVIN